MRNALSNLFFAMIPITNGSGKLRKEIARLYPCLIPDAGATIHAWIKIGLYPHFVNRTFAVGSQHTKRIRVGPFEGLLLPFHPE